MDREVYICNIHDTFFFGDENCCPDCQSEWELIEDVDDPRIDEAMAFQETAS